MVHEIEFRNGRQAGANRPVVCDDAGIEAAELLIQSRRLLDVIIDLGRLRIRFREDATHPPQQSRNAPAAISESSRAFSDAVPLRPLTKSAFSAESPDMEGHPDDQSQQDDRGGNLNPDHAA